MTYLTVLLWHGEAPPQPLIVNFHRIQCTSCMIAWSRTAAVRPGGQMPPHRNGSARVAHTPLSGSPIRAGRRVGGRERPCSVLLAPPSLPWSASRPKPTRGHPPFATPSFSAAPRRRVWPACRSGIPAARARSRSWCRGIAPDRGPPPRGTALPERAVRPIRHSART